MRLSPERMGSPEPIGVEDPSINAHSEHITIAHGANTHGILNQHPASDAAGHTPHTAGLPASGSKGGIGPDAGQAPVNGSNGSGAAAGAEQGRGASAGGSPSGAQSRRESAGAAKGSGAGGDGRAVRLPFRVGMSEDRNKRWRRTMEDSHAFVYGFGGVHGQGFFGVFDGHAGKHSAEWCGEHFHEYLLQTLSSKPDTSVPDVLNETFHQADQALSKLAQEQGSSSGCTAVTAFLRLEDEHGVPVTGKATGGIVKGGSSGNAIIGGASSSSGSSTTKQPQQQPGQEGDALTESKSSSSDAANESTTSSSSSRTHNLFHAFSRKHRAEKDAAGDTSVDEPVPAVRMPHKPELVTAKSGLVTVTGRNVRRVLYTANVGDARAVLCRGGKAIRLTYDHKGSDAQEAKRITDAGGFVMNNRVNGVLAVTRSLGDSSMKEFVVGAPYTTETTLGEDDTFLIVACDGLWDVVDDQDAVDLIKDVEDPQDASDQLLRHALANFSTDNTSVMVVRFAARPDAISDPHQPDEAT